MSNATTDLPRNPHLAAMAILFPRVARRVPVFWRKLNCAFCIRAQSNQIDIESPYYWRRSIGLSLDPV